MYIAWRALCIYISVTFGIVSDDGCMYKTTTTASSQQSFAYYIRKYIGVYLQQQLNDYRWYIFVYICKKNDHHQSSILVYICNNN